jgi:hypothetical protein
LTHLRDVTVHVIDEDGRAVSEAAVAVIEAEFDFPEIAMLTNERGNVQFQAPTGSLVVCAMTADERSGEAFIARGDCQAAVTVVVMRHA